MLVYNNMTSLNFKPGIGGQTDDRERLATPVTPTIGRRILESGSTSKQPRARPEDLVKFVVFNTGMITKRDMWNELKHVLSQS